MTCGGCKFYVRDHDTTNLGKCHRYPPVLALDYYRFVVVTAHDWCGEYQSKPSMVGHRG